MLSITITILLLLVLFAICFVCVDCLMVNRAKINDKRNNVLFLESQFRFLESNTWELNINKGLL
jgi:hypothetical protein